MASTLRFDKWENTLGVPYGTVLQVKQTVLSSALSFSPSAITGTPTIGNTTQIMTINITPTFSNSKILIMADVNYASTTSTPGMIIFRGTTPVGIGDIASNRRRISSGTGYHADANQIAGAGNITFLDSPETTGEITYSIRCSSDSTSTVVVNRSINYTDSTTGATSISTLTLMEIAQ
jgi:hypothetical protein